MNEALLQKSASRKLLRFIKRRCEKIPPPMYTLRLKLPAVNKSQYCIPKATRQLRIKKTWPFLAYSYPDPLNTLNPQVVV